jgi:hypothetical protein
MTIGGKYIWKPDSNPPVGAYNIQSGIDIIKPTIPSAIIKDKIVNTKRIENSPGPG